MSDWYQIESNALVIQVTSKGAEMKRLFSREWHRELLWLGDEKNWNRSAPVLFPIVGKLKDDEYQLKGKTYKMPQHGFARDMEFKCIKCEASEVAFVMEATQETYNQYPFLFELSVIYKVEDSKVTISYFVKNTDRQDIFFSIGAHPGFETKNLSHYEIHFEKEEKEYFRLNEGQVDFSHSTDLHSNVLELNPELFKEDALIFKKLKSRYVDLVDKKRNEIIRLHSNTSHWGIWGKGNVPFVCLEPWYGLADVKGFDKNLETKEGIITLGEGELFGFSYTLEMKVKDTPEPVKKK